MQPMMRTLSLIVTLALAVGLIGCNKPNQDLVRDDDSARQLADRIRDLENQLAQAQARNQADRAEIDRLQRELAEARASQPTEPAGWQSVPGGAMTEIEGTLLFDSGKADLKPGAKKMLAQLAQTISQQYPEREILVFGHTDTDPIKHSKWKDNYELSCQRSLAVVRALQGDGLANYMAACGWGENKPRSQDKQANRRVEIFAMIPQAN